MRYTNMSDLPEFVVNFLSANDYPDHGWYTIGVTSLIDSPRIRRLSLEQPDLLKDEVMSRVDSAIGSAVHTAVAKADNTGITEQRFSAKVKHGKRYIKISGQPDKVIGDVLYDIKTSKATSAIYGIKPHWIQQTNVYRWLLHRNDIDVNSIKIVAIYKDWSIGEKRRMENSGYTYPAEPISVINIPVWDMESTHDYVMGRVDAHMALELPECTFDERWARASKYAIQKGSKYRAERVLDTLEEAYEWADYNNIYLEGVVDGRSADIKGYYISRRPEVWARCANYCPVSEWCEQWNSFNTTPALPEE